MGSLAVQAEYIGKAFETINSSGTGVTALLVCSALSETVPAAGLLISNFSDQNNPITTSAQQVADASVAPNGQLVAWTTPNYVDVTISVVANSLDDYLLWGAATACRKKAGLSSPGTPPPLWTITVIYPNAIGQSRQYTNGVMLTGDLGASMGANARINSKSYTFRFIGCDNSEGTGGFPA